MAIGDPNSKIARNTRPTFSRLGILLLIGLCVLFVSSYTNRLLRKADVEQEIVVWEQRISDAEDRQQELLAELEYVESSAYAIGVARNYLDMALPGDTVIIVMDEPPPLDASADTAEITQEDVTANYEPPGDPVWMQWLSILTGDE